MKRCSRCDAVKSLSEFYSKRRSSDGHTPACKECTNKANRRYVEDNRERVTERQRSWRRRRLYSVDDEMYEALLHIQGGLCATCEKRPPVHVDHDHETGLVRGLLCSQCNHAIGLLGDDPAVVCRVLLYLRYYEACRAAP